MPATPTVVTSARPASPAMMRGTRHPPPERAPRRPPGSFTAADYTAPHGDAVR
jgi:hypothetical protein